ncbi:alpha-ketoglutarate-dependent dioxygenase AlkB family protein [Christiangramia portivictoriae]|uniref:alpha-ketoglutarate-dependent dioxygenase AlkB family protein n=1 Tax=Christiangramia portivictoriae TaxID=326069 RepID=UPI000429FB36|nr:alpha-ketoglutarate-dependent dioxygenase AlkB [Christiangramia portivictoriae]
MEGIDLQNASLLYDEQFLSERFADELFDRLMEYRGWRQDHIKMFGKEILQPRLTALFSNNDRAYTYSGLTMHPEIFPKYLLEVKERCEKKLEQSFNACLANLYRDGQDSMGWHADDEKELGTNPVIASISIGEPRIFHLKHRSVKGLIYKKRLQHGSLLVMKGETQQFWKHQLPKTKKQIGSRINLTFRRIY